MKILNSASLVVFLFIVCSVTIYAQGNNPKVLKYTAPIYPQAALAVRASGKIIVTVKIDKGGKVISAVAESGHPLLRKVSENAANEWIFSTDSNNEERDIKITFLLRIGDKNKKEKVKFKKPYTLEVIGVRVRIINTIDY